MSRLVSRAQSFRRVGVQDFKSYLAALRGRRRLSALRALFDAPIVAQTLRRRGARPLLVHLSRHDGRLDPEQSLDVSRAVDAALAILPISATCLRRSVTLTRELDRLGLASTIHVGVRRSNGEIEAHAWVQSASVVINDDPEVTGTYGELASGELEQFAHLLR